MNSMRRWPALASAILLLIIALAIALPLRRRRKGTNPSVNDTATSLGICHVYLVDIMMVDPSGSVKGGGEDHHFFECEILTESGESDDYLSLTLSHDVVAQNAEALEKNEWYIKYDDERFDTESGRLQVIPDELVETVPIDSVRQMLQQAQYNRRTRSTPNNLRGNEKQEDSSAPALKTRRNQVTPEIEEERKDKIIIIRVTTADDQVTQSADELHNYILGEEDSLMRQYRDCSHGEIELKLSDPNEQVIEVEVSRNTSDYDFNTIFLEANKIVKQRFGGKALHFFVQHAIYVVPDGIKSPPGTAAGLRLVAFAGINHFKVVITETWVHAVGVLLHEASHNRGLGHAWENGDEYGDVSGAMAQPRKSVDKLCFNGLHFDTLGWMANRTVRVDPVASPTIIDLVAFTDFEQATEGQATVIQVVPSWPREDLPSYWLTYNRKKSFNIDTQEKLDEVLVVERKPDDFGSVSSNMVASINENRVFFRLNFFAPGLHLVIEACQTNLDPDSVTLSIGTRRGRCPKVAEEKKTDKQVRIPTVSPTTRPTTAPTTNPTTAPTTSPTASPTATPAVTPSDDSEIPNQVFRPIIQEEDRSQNLPQTEQCDDDQNILIWFDSTLKYQRCSWLCEHADQPYDEMRTVKDVFCSPDHDAYDACQETCGKCTDACEDEVSTTLSFMGVEMDCASISKKPYLWTLACSKEEIRGSCKETCNNCS